MKYKKSTKKIIRAMIDRDKLLLSSFDISPIMAKNLLKTRIEVMEKSLNIGGTE